MRRGCRISQCAVDTGTTSGCFTSKTTCYHWGQPAIGYSCRNNTIYAINRRYSKACAATSRKCHCCYSRVRIYNQHCIIRLSRTKTSIPGYNYIIRTCIRSDQTTDCKFIAEGSAYVACIAKCTGAGFIPLVSYTRRGCCGY